MYFLISHPKVDRLKTGLPHELRPCMPVRKGFHYVPLERWLASSSAVAAASTAKGPVLLV